MIDNPGHVAVAENLIQQVQEGKVPSLAAAAKEAGYNYDGASKIKATVSFQRALWEAMPFKMLAAIQRKQLGAERMEKVSWPDDWTIEQAQKAIASREWVEVYTSRNKNGELRSLVMIPLYDHIDKALDKYYKLAGFYAAEKVEHQVTRPLEEMSEEELNKMIGLHNDNEPVKLDKSIPNVITGEPQANIIDVEPV